MTQQHYILPLKAPTPLPASGVDITTFKVWRNTLVAHVQQDANHHLFMPEGIYQTWRAADIGSRIQAIEEEDPDKLILDGKRARSGEKFVLLRTRCGSLFDTKNTNKVSRVSVAGCG